jgi:hypothetical protein
MNASAKNGATAESLAKLKSHQEVVQVLQRFPETVVGKAIFVDTQGAGLEHTGEVKEYFPGSFLGGSSKHRIAFDDGREEKIALIGSGCAGFHVLGPERSQERLKKRTEEVAAEKAREDRAQKKRAKEGGGAGQEAVEPKEEAEKDARSESRKRLEAMKQAAEEQAAAEQAAAEQAAAEQAAAEQAAGGQDVEEDTGKAEEEFFSPVKEAPLKAKVDEQDNANEEVFFSPMVTDTVDGEDREEGQEHEEAQGQEEEQEEEEQEKEVWQDGVEVVTKEALEVFYEDNCANQEAYEKSVAGIADLLRLNTTQGILSQCENLFGSTPATTTKHKQSSGEQAEGEQGQAEGEQGQAEGEQAEGEQAEGGQAAAPEGDWSTLIDPTDGTPYYHNESTGETQWDKPEELVEAEKADKGPGGKSSQSARVADLEQVGVLDDFMFMCVR